MKQFYGIASAVLLLFLGFRCAAAATNVIVAGETLSGSITNAGQEDVYSFSGASNQTITIVFAGTNLVEAFPDMELRGTNGSLLISSHDLEHSVSRIIDAFPLPQSGDYTIICRDAYGAYTFDYGLTLIKVPGTNRSEVGEANAIAPGETKRGRIGAVTDIDAYTFTGVSNQTVTILLADSNLDQAFPYMELRGTNGSLLVSGHDLVHGASLIIDSFPLPQSGDYTIICRDAYGAYTFDYILSLAGNPNIILPGETKQGNIDTSAASDTYTFSGAFNQRVTILLAGTNLGEAFPYMELRGTDGSLLTTGSDLFHGSSLIIDGFRLPQSDDYTIICRDAYGAYTFDYALTLITIPGSNLVDVGEGTGTLAPDEPQAGNLTAGDMDAYIFWAIAGDSVSIKLSTGGPNPDPVIKLYAPNGNDLGVGSTSLSPTVRVRCLDQTGNYLVLCRGRNGIEDFNYNLTLTQTPVVPVSSETNQFLAIFECTNHIIVRWSTNSSSFILESASLLPNLGWAPVTDMRREVYAGYYFADALATNVSRFFRLHCAGCVPAPP
jgi:hypothetical protein